MLHSSLGDVDRLARIARNFFAVLFLVAGLVWLLP
ncbi:hypothetical protein SACE_0858 [Saccharopolyspora erythraea NRRL 2338]|uniref:Uncharacterized protein n=1 Tax=Saccharopolyspora erythraea (strain ATCC 11635 / DSM 40517 / JCM 4748 / NBRC 13426 / NCIMB 8594 / NRRL 2338) TaxID=405948 RepID=A4F823_SACEN|nr:hypothetical protein N599_11210 [Saccharopolyspora erythraea D]CAM00198.1 hypothetical protein SACE_0858 [Saccharopolyspora erythraea NRRL 2338]